MAEVKNTQEDKMSESQVLYLGRWVSREHFRAYVYNNSEQKLAKSYDEFAQLISSGVWSAERRDAPIVEKKTYLEKENKLMEEFIPATSKIIDIAPKKRGRKCQNQRKV